MRGRAEQCMNNVICNSGSMLWLSMGFSSSPFLRVWNSSWSSHKNKLGHCLVSSFPWRFEMRLGARGDSDLRWPRNIIDADFATIRRKSLLLPKFTDRKWWLLEGTATFHKKSHLRHHRPSNLNHPVFVLHSKRTQKKNDRKTENKKTDGRKKKVIRKLQIYRRNKAIKKKKEGNPKFSYMTESMACICLMCAGAANDSVFKSILIYLSAL